MDNGGAFTDRLLAGVDIAPGAAALDIGCGGGDVTVRLARAVGPQGRVVGIDPNAAALDVARRRARDGGLDQVTFEDRDLLAMGATGARFDAVTCRRVLMYLPDRVGAARAMRALLKPGGLLVVQEHDVSIFHATAPLPLHRRARGWIWDTVRTEGADTETGFDLHAILAEAGFSDIAIVAEAVVETPSQAGQTARIVEAMLPRIEAAGVATAAEIDAGTLDARLAAEREAAGATVVGEMMFGATARA